MQIPLIASAVILFFLFFSFFLSWAQGAPQHSGEHRKTASLHFICYGEPKKRASYKNPQLIWEYLAMHN